MYVYYIARSRKWAVWDEFYLVFQFSYNVHLTYDGILTHTTVLFCWVLVIGPAGVDVTWLRINGSVWTSAWLMMMCWCVLSTAASEHSSRGGDVGVRPPPPLPPPRFPNSAVWQWETLNIGNFTVAAPLPLPLPLLPFLSAPGLALEGHLTDIICRRGKACVSYLRHSIKRTSSGDDWRHLSTDRVSRRTANQLSIIPQRHHTTAVTVTKTIISCRRSRVSSPYRWWATVAEPSPRIIIPKWFSGHV